MLTKKIIVPSGMLKAACDAMEAIIPIKDMNDCRAGFMKRSLEAALRWLAENPIVPTEGQLNSLRTDCIENADKDGFSRGICIEWQRRMFLAEPEVPEAVKDLLLMDAVTFELPNGSKMPGAAAEYNNCIIEAYKRGKNDR